MREDEIASLPTEEERRREVRSTVSVHLVRFDMIRCNPVYYDDQHGCCISTEAHCSAQHSCALPALQMRKRREFLKIKREEAKQDEGVQVAIPAPDPPLPPNFDADTNTHRYRFLEAPGGWLARCVFHLFRHK